jgi:hypothetical protein
MPQSEPLAQQDYQSGTLTDAIEFLKRTHSELRELRKVRIWLDRIQVFDINGDYFEIVGVGYPDRSAIALLEAVNAAFNPETIHAPIESRFKEFKTGRRRAWAEDRVM